MDWNDLHYFVCLVETQTLSAAAEKLCVQHSTVARRIERLEIALKLRLFDRVGKRYQLTDEGRLLYSQASGIRQQVVDFQRMAVSHRAMAGEVVISAPPAFANECLLPQVADFSARFPDIVLRLLGDAHISNLYKREADIALRLSRPEQSDLVLRRLREIRYGFFARCDAFDQKTGIFAGPFVEFQASSRLQDWFQSVVERHHGRVVFRSNDFYLIRHAIVLGIGAGILPEFLAQAERELQAFDPFSRQMLTEPEKYAEQAIPAKLSSSLYLVMHEDVRRSARVRAVADWLIEILSEKRESLPKDEGITG